MLGPMQIKTILYDLDGTLIDTEPAAARAIDQSFKSWGIKIDPKDSKFITGRTWAVAFDFFFKKYAIPLEPLTAGEQMLEAYRQELQRELPRVPGGAESVRRLSTQYPLGLVSGSSRKEIFFALDQLKIRDHFKVVLGCEDYPNSKPSPDGYNEALKLLGADPKGCLIFEDSEAGIASARAAGAWVVAITSTNHFGQDTSGAHATIEDLSCVDLDWIKILESRIG